MGDSIPNTPVPVPTYGQPPARSNASTPTPAASSAETATGESSSAPKDIAMTDVAASTEQAPSPAPAASSTNAPSPAPTGAGRTGTPLRSTANGQEGSSSNNNNNNSSSSRAASQHPDPGFTMPAEAPPHGAPVRQYLNSKVTGALLEGMKVLAKEQPKDPLRVLGEYLLQRSKELET